MGLIQFYFESLNNSEGTYKMMFIEVYDVKKIGYLRPLKPSGRIGYLRPLKLKSGQNGCKS